jgi:MerR family transcriptional regulator, heat shock protein HspR
MNEARGIYVMRIASRLAGMHPQTLRKYEREGLLKPWRSKNARLYAEDDIDRLKEIKHLVNDIGLNMAGVRLILEIRDKILQLKSELASADPDYESQKHLESSLNGILENLTASPLQEKLNFKDNINEK